MKELPPGEYLFTPVIGQNNNTGYNDGELVNSSSVWYEAMFIPKDQYSFDYLYLQCWAIDEGEYIEPCKPILSIDLASDLKSETIMVKRKEYRQFDPNCYKKDRR